MPKFLYNSGHTDRQCYETFKQIGSPYYIRSSAQLSAAYSRATPRYEIDETLYCSLSPETAIRTRAFDRLHRQ